MDKTEAKKIADDALEAIDRLSRRQSISHSDLECLADVRGIIHVITEMNAKLVDKTDTITTLRARLKAARELLNWIAHLHHGCSKGGPEFEPPSEQEWTDCLDKITAWLAENGEE